VVAAEGLIIVVAAVAIFEVAEHVVIPIAVAVAARRRRSVTGAEGMVGKVGDVTDWSGRAGRVRIDGELWRAESPTPLAAGDAVVVRAVRGLTLDVTASH
jgi:membrane-bound serine protease (ClpP class)